MKVHGLAHMPQRTGRSMSSASEAEEQFAVGALDAAVAGRAPGPPLPPTAAPWSTSVPRQAHPGTGDQAPARPPAAAAIGARIVDRGSTIPGGRSGRTRLAIDAIASLMNSRLSNSGITTSKADHCAISGR